MMGKNGKEISLGGIRSMLKAVVVMAIAAVGFQSGSVWADAKELRLARQFGIAYIPFMIMERDRLIEKAAASMGLGDVKVTWTQLGSGASMNDALLTGNLDFASAGIPVFMTLWDKTKGNANVMVAAGLNNIPVFLNTTNPNVRTIRDFTDKDRIALAAVKVSLHAIVLQMAAAQVWGQDNYAKLDPLTVSMKHPDGMIALLAAKSEITAHFTSPPYMFQELQDPRARLVLNSMDVMGPANFNVIYATQKFRDLNPKLYKAFLMALEESMTIVNHDKRAATQLYVKMTQAKPSTFDSLYKMVTDPRIEFTSTPNGLMKFSEFMYKVGTIKNKVVSWQDFCFPEARAMSGS